MREDCWLNLSLFGTATLARSCPTKLSQPLKPLPLCAQSRNLLAYLALARGQARTRSQLSRALRGDGAEPARAGSISSALWRLRQTLESPPFAPGELLSAQRDGLIGLRADAPLRVDVDSYLQHVLPVLALPLADVDAAAEAGLRQGVALYTGELLPGAHDDWVLREREKLRQIQLNALGRLVQLSVRAGDASAGVRHAQAILDIDDLREDVHRDLMRLYLLAGQRALALRQYESCRQVLRRELSIVPMPETQALYQQIAAGAIAHHVPVGTGAGAGTGVENNSGSNASTGLAELLNSARRHLAAADTQLLRATLPH